MIHIFSPWPPDTFFGGVRKLYDHAEQLNNWWPTQVIPTYRSVPLEKEPTPGDLLVIPEIYGDDLRKAYPGVARISFCQNPYYELWGKVSADHPYTDTPELIAVLTVTDHACDLLRFTFGNDLRIDRIDCCIDREQGTLAQRFYCGSFPRPRQLCYFGRKSAGEPAAILLGMLRARGSLDGWGVVDMAGMSDEDVARTMRESAIYLAFGQREGRQDPPLEAMACGCDVVGFAGGGGLDYWPAFERIRQDDYIAFVERVELSMRYRPDEHERKVSGRILANYSRARELEQLEQLYSEYVGLAAK